MSSIKRGKINEARALFAETGAKMKLLPTEDKNPTAGKIYLDDFYHDDLILWLVCKEVQAIFGAVGAQ